MFILKPGQFVHINKGRLHAFRKLSYALLPPDDCHSKLRQELILSISSDSNQSLNESLCISVAWDWTYRGFTSEAINRELSSMMECAALNRYHGAQSLAIPETSVLFTAKTLLACAKAAHKTNNECMLLRNNRVNVSSLESSYNVYPNPMAILRGILPSLAHVVHRHQAAVDNAKKIVAEGTNSTLSLKPYPDSWENCQLSAIDPYGNDYFCKLCQVELSNVYFHCNGCETLLFKDFNICTR